MELDYINTPRTITDRMTTSEPYRTQQPITKDKQGTVELIKHTPFIRSQLDLKGDDQHLMDSIR